MISLRRASFFCSVSRFQLRIPATTGVNLARAAVATASESLSDMIPSKAIDGNTGTRWSGIPVITQAFGSTALGFSANGRGGPCRQYDRFVTQWDLQTWDDSAGQWITKGHYAMPVSA